MHQADLPWNLTSRGIRTCWFLTFCTNYFCCIMVQLRNRRYKVSLSKYRRKKDINIFKVWNLKRQALHRFNVKHFYKQMWLKTNMADNSLLCPQIPVQNPGFLYHDIVDGSILGVKTNPLLSLPPCSPLFITSCEAQNQWLSVLRYP